MTHFAVTRFLRARDGSRDFRCTVFPPGRMPGSTAGKMPATTWSAAKIPHRHPFPIVFRQARSVQGPFESILAGKNHQFQVLPADTSAALARFG